LVAVSFFTFQVEKHAIHVKAKTKYKSRDTIADIGGINQYGKYKNKNQKAAVFVIGEHEVYIW